MIPKHLYKTNSNRTQSTLHSPRSSNPSHPHPQESTPSLTPSEEMRHPLNNAAHWAKLVQYALVPLSARCMKFINTGVLAELVLCDQISPAQY